jgi:DNA polymerase-3 subunit epsilon
MYAVLDIETTGGKYDEEGITEIAIYRFDGEKIIDQFSSLINPEKEIQPFVKKLTGINNNMLRNSPKFYEVAKRIVEITENCIIVAHNAEFDFRMLQTEFRRLSFTFNRKILCTIKLSKILLPNQPSFNLGKLVNNLGIPFTNQHRAHGDAKVTLKLFQLLLEKDSKKYILKKNIQNLNPNKTPTKYLSIIDKLPSEMGIYYIHNTNNEIIYIGNSNNIKKRVLSHLTGSKNKALEIQKVISNVSYSLTGGELISLLKEQNEIKLNSPIYNKSMKFRLFPIGIRIDYSYDYPNIIVEQVKKDRQYLCVYKNKKTAKTAIFKFIDEFGICIHKTNLIRAEGECLNYSLKKCNGACINRETISDYRKKINAFCKSFEYQSKDFLLIDKGRQSGEFSFVYVENNSLLGYGYYELNHQIKTKDQIESRLIPIEDNLDTQKLIHSFILRKKYIKLINLQDKD